MGEAEGKHSEGVEEGLPVPTVVLGQKFSFSLQKASLTFQGSERFFLIGLSGSGVVTQLCRFLRHHLIIPLLSDLGQHAHLHKSLPSRAGSLQ